MENISNQAAYFREALKLGAVSLDDVVSWSDSVIAKCPTPDYALIELSCAGNAHPLDVLHLLESLSSHVSTVDALPAVLGLAHQRLAADPTYGRELARALYGVYVECGYNVPDELRDIGWFDDSFDLAYQGTYGSVEKIQEELFQFTGRFAERANNSFKADASGAA